MTWFKKLVPKSVDVPLPDEEEQETEEQSDGGELAVDVFQEGDNVILQSTVAGVKPDDIDITLAPDQVTIRGERRQQREIEEGDYFFQECYWGDFSRTVGLPVEIDVDRAEADIKDGILTLTLPKAGKSRTKKVKVRGEENE